MSLPFTQFVNKLQSLSIFTPQPQQQLTTTSKPKPGGKYDLNAILSRLTVDDEEEEDGELLDNLKRRNMFTINSSSELVYCEAINKITNRFYLISLKALKSQKEDFVQSLNLVPIIDFEVLEIKFNSLGNYFFIRGRGLVSVAQLSHKRSAERDDRQYPKVTCRTFPIFNDYLVNDPTLTIVKCDWHPFSSVHLLVLTSDNVLRMFDLSQSFDRPEQTFYLHPSAHVRDVSFRSSSSKASFVSELNPQESVVSFDFGRRGRWERFTIFFATEEGNVFSLCPVVPYNCLLPQEYFNGLQGTQPPFEEDEEDDYGDRLTQMQREVRDFLSQILNEDAEQYAVRHGDQMRTETSLLNISAAAPLRIQEEDHDSPIGPARSKMVSFVRTQRPLNQLFRSEKLRPVGPLQVLSGDLDRGLSGSKASGATCCDIFVTKSTPPAILLLYNDARIEISLLLDEIQPNWLVENADAPQLTFYEEVNLSLPSGVTTPPQQHQDEYSPGSPSFFADPLNRDSCVYCIHTAGVHRLSFPFLNDFEKFCLLQSTQSSSLQLSSTSVSYLFSTMPLQSSVPSRPIGFDVTTDPFIGYHMFAMIKPHKLLVRNMEQMMLLMAIAAEKTTPTGKQSKIPDFESIIASIDNNIQPVPQVSLPSQLVKEKNGSTTTKEPSQEALALFTKMCAMFNDRVVKINQLDAQIRKRVEFLGKYKNEQLGQIKALETQLKERETKDQQQTDRINAMIEKQKEINRRADDLLEKIIRSQPKLSIKEREYFEDLHNTMNKVNLWNKKIKQLQAQADKLTEIADHQAQEALMRTPSVAGGALTRKQSEYIEQLLEETKNTLETIVKTINKIEGNEAAASSPRPTATTPAKTSALPSSHAADVPRTPPFGQRRPGGKPKMAAIIESIERETQ